MDLHVCYATIKDDKRQSKLFKNLNAALMLQSISYINQDYSNMAETIPAFEAELFQKIQFKASSKVSLDAFLFKAFKFFDLHNSGFLNKQDFFRAIAKCGVVVDTHDMDAVFSHYADPDGKLDYRHFIQQLLFKEDQIESNSSKLKSSQQQRPLKQNNDNKSQLSGSQFQGNKSRLEQSKINKIYNKCETYAQVLDFTKRKLQQQGPGSLLAFAVRVKSTDVRKTHHINKKTLQSTAPFLQEEHLNLIFKELSQNQNEIDYSVLVYDLKGQVQEERVKEIENVFNLLDTRREGEFPINYLISRFLSKSQAESFKHSVELYSQFQGIDDGVFTQDDFHDCLGFLSFDHNSNEAFKNHLIRPFFEEDNKSVASHRSNRSRDFPSNKSQLRQEPAAEFQQADFKKNKDSPIASKLGGEQEHFAQFPEERSHKDEKKSVSRYSQLEHKDVPANHLREIESVILRIKKRLASKGTKGFLVFEKAMKNADIDRDTLLNYEQFKQVIKDQRIDITNTEVDMIFNVFDEQGTNLISFPEFMFTLRGKMPEARKEYEQRLWNQVKLTEETTNFAKIKKCLNFRNHPDVQSGRKFEEDIWKQIQQTILTIQQLNGTPRSDIISKPEFQEYLENLSLSIIDDKLYESVLQNFWKLESSINISEKYAGSRKVFETSKNCYLLDHHRYVVKGGSVSQNAPFGTTQEPTNYFTEHGKL